MITVTCTCGGSISAPSSEAAGPYVEGHNASVEHTAWRRRNEADLPAGLGWTLRECLPTGLTTYRVPRRPTAATVDRDVSGNTSGASAGEGAA